MMAVFKLKKGVTVEQVKKAVALERRRRVGKLTAGGGDPSVTAPRPSSGPARRPRRSTELTAGHYGMCCFLAAPDGTTHVAHGMIKVFDVTGKST